MIRNFPQLRLRRPQMEKVVGAGDIANAGMGQIAEHTDRRLTNGLVIRVEQCRRQEKGTQPPVGLTPGLERDSSLRFPDRYVMTKALMAAPFDFARATAEAIAVEQPGILGELREKLLAKRHDAHALKM